MADFFDGKRGALMLSVGESRHSIVDRAKAARDAVGADAFDKKGVKKVLRLIEGADPKLAGSYIKEGRYTAWKQYVRDHIEFGTYDPEHPDVPIPYDPAHPMVPDFGAFTVEKRPKNGNGRITYLPIRKHVTYQPNQPVKTAAHGCKYGSYEAGGRVFCFRNPDHHKIRDRPVDVAKQRGINGGNATTEPGPRGMGRRNIAITAEQREAYRRRRHTAAGDATRLVQEEPAAVEQAPTRVITKKPKRNRELAGLTTAVNYERKR